MNLIWTIGRQDFLMTFRDPVFKGLLIFPFIAFGLVRWLYPVLAAEFQSLQDYSQVILMWAMMQSATMFGFIYGFLMLEEKEEKIDYALGVLPLSNLNLLFYRLAFGSFISVLVNYMLLHYGLIIDLPWWQEILLAFQFSLIAPIMALFLSAFAGNKIEGLAQMKIVNLVLLIPALVYFFPFKLLQLTAIVPSYWFFRSLGAAQSSDFYWIYLVGIGYALLIMWWCNRRIKNH